MAPVISTLRTGGAGSLADEGWLWNWLPPKSAEKTQSSLNQRDVEGLGRRTNSSGWQKIGDCCGWAAPLLLRPSNGHHHHGRATRGAASTPEVALLRARRRKERTHPELHGADGRARLVVLVAGGKWSNEAAQLLEG